MPISLACPHCGTATEVGAQYVGQSGPCAACGKMVTVGSPDGTPGYAGKSSGSKTMTCAVVACVAFVGMLVVAGVLAAFLLPAVRSGREAARRTACMYNVKQIGRALIDYESANGTFPPAYTVDENGNRLHSWRTLILPYLEHEHVFNQVNLDEPWDAPGNFTVTDTVVHTYHCPADKNNSTDTNYVMIVGPKTASPGEKARTHQEISDGASVTIMVVEVTGLGIHWAEPRDLEADNITCGINDGTGGIGSQHIDGAWVVHADGSIHYLPNTMAAQAIHDMTTAAGGEPVTVPYMEL